MSVLPEPNAEGYNDGNTTACHDQLVEFLQASPPVDGDSSPRALAFEIAYKVGKRHCTHTAEPQPLGDMRKAARKKAAAEHPGLCGVYHAGIIAAVKTSDVAEKWGEHNLTANKYRNQVSTEMAVCVSSRSAPRIDGRGSCAVFSNGKHTTSIIVAFATLCRCPKSGTPPVL